MVANNTSNKRARFAVGQIVVTPGALAALEEAGQNPIELIARHVSGEWGDLGNEDKRLNDEACAHEGNLDQQGRILSAYRTAKGVKLWIISEYDRSVTTILLPEEY